MKLKLRIFALMAMLLCFAFQANADEITTGLGVRNALINGGEHHLGNDVTTTTAITTSGVTSVIDLSGHTLTIGAGDIKFCDASNITIKNGTISITGLTVGGNAVFCLDEYEKTLVTTLTLENVNLVGEDYSSAYCIFYIGSSSVLNVKGGVWSLENDKSTSGGVFKAEDSAATLNIDGLNLTAHNVRRVVLYAATTIKNSTLAISGDADGVDAEMEHGFNRSPLAISNSTITMTDMVGRGITAENGAVTIENSTVTMTNCQEATIDVRGGQTVTIDDASTVELDKEPTIASGTISGDVVLPVYVAQVGETKYTTLADAISAAQAGDVVKVFEGTYDLPSMKAGITIEGVGNVLLEGTLGGTLENLTLKNLHIKGANAQRWAYAKGDLVFENVIFEATSVYALHFDGITEGATLLYKDCTIIGWAAMSGSPASCVFDGCTFKDNGTYGVIRTYFDANIENCTFDVANANPNDVYPDGIDAAGGAEIVVDGCTNANGAMKDIVNVNGTSVVSVDGVEIKNVAQVGDVEYTSLQAAVDAATTGQTIILLADVELTETLIIPADKTVVLNLNSKAVSMADASGATAALIKNNGNLTITDGTEGKAGKLSFNSTTPSATNGYASNTISNYGTITIEAGTIENTTVGGACYALDNYAGSTATINGGKLTAEKTTVRIFNWTDGDAAKATLNVNGGEIYSKDGYAINVNSGNAPAVALNITGGTITTDDTDYNLAVYVVNKNTAENFTASVTGGTFNGYYALNGVTSATMAKGAVSITGGTFTGVRCYDEPAYGFISGGTYTYDVNEFCAEGFACEQNADGTYGIDEKVELPEVEITDIKGSLTDSDPDLTFALNFTIKDLENLDEEYLAKVMEKYGNWYTDYVLTISGLTDENVTFNANGDSDGYLAGQYDGAGTNWVSVPFENVTLANNESIYIMEYAAKLLGQSGLRYTLAEIVSIVMDFDCGVYFTPEFLTANPGLKVDLHLKVFTEDAEGNKVNDINVATNNFDVEDYVAIVHADNKQTTYCTTLADAVAAADGKTITLLRDVELTETLTIPADKTIALDLNGKTISQTKEQTAAYQMILNDGNLTVDDSSESKAGKISYTDSGNGGEYISDVIYNRSVLVINGGTIENLSSATVASNGYPHAVDTYSGIRDTYVEINGGTIYCAEYSAIRMFCVSATNKADLVINGGTIKGAIDMQNGSKPAALGTLTINDGTFETTKNANNIRFANWNGGATEYGISAEIKGGSFNGGITTAYVPAAANWNKGIISGGTYARDMTDYCAYGYVCEANEDATYGVVAREYFELDEGVAYTNNKDFEDVTVKYSRKLSNVGKWYALYLPVEIPVSFFLDNGYSIAEYSTMHSYDDNEDEVIDRMTMEVKHITDAAATLEANYPYFIRANSAEAQTLEIELTNTTLYAAKSTKLESEDIEYKYTLTGTYEPVASTENETRYALFANGVWDIMNGILKPFRHYLTVTDNEGSNVKLPTEALKAMRIVARGEEGFEGTTGVETVETPSTGNDVIYDLSGRPVEEPVKGGIYIINGEKVVY